MGCPHRREGGEQNCGLRWVGKAGASVLRACWGLLDWEKEKTRNSRTEKTRKKKTYSSPRERSDLNGWTEITRKETTRHLFLLTKFVKGLGRVLELGKKKMQEGPEMMGTNGGGKFRLGKKNKRCSYQGGWVGPWRGGLWGERKVMLNSSCKGGKGRG